MKLRKTVIALTTILGASLMAFNALAIYRIHDAAHRGDIAEVRKAIEAGDDIDAMDQKYGHTPLGFAAESGNLEMAKLLLEKGAKVDLVNIFFNSPLIIAAQNGHLKVAELLISQGANVNYKGKKDLTPLHYAAINGHAEIVKLLLEKGAELNAKDKNGHTPLTYAQKNNHLEIVELLQHHGTTE